MPMKPNGHVFDRNTGPTLVGHRFDANDESSLPPHVRGKPQIIRERLAAELNERYRIAATCVKCKRPLIKEEVMPHKLSHAPNGAVRSLVGTVLQRSPEIQQQTLAFLKEVLE